VRVSALATWQWLTRAPVLQHTPVAVKILKEGEVSGALGSVAMAGESDLADIRKNLVRVRALRRTFVSHGLVLQASARMGSDVAPWSTLHSR
jgi:hypothetical protein